MSHPEEFREEVYLAQGFPADGIRGQLGGQMERSPVQGEREVAGRETFREAAGQEQFGRDQLNRETLDRVPDRVSGRETLNREPEGPEPVGREDAGRLTAGRLMGSPLPGTPLPGGSGAFPGQDMQMNRGVTPPGRALAPTSASEDASAMQRAMGILKQAAPFVARLLPLIDGNITAAVGNLLSPRPHAPAPPVDLTPVHQQISELQLQQNEFRGAIHEQTSSLKRVEDQLDMVREATDRNTLEQQELMGDLKSMGRRVNLVATGLSILLVLSIVMNLILYLYVRRALP
jgi:hypothetical protein